METPDSGKRTRCWSFLNQERIARSGNESCGPVLDRNLYRNARGLAFFLLIKRRQTGQRRGNYLLPPIGKEVIPMNRSGSNRCYSRRIRLEKLKQKTWRLIVLARVLLILATLVAYYLGRK